MSLQLPAVHPLFSQQASATKIVLASLPRRILLLLEAIFPSMCEKAYRAVCLPPKLFPPCIKKTDVKNLGRDVLV